MNDKEKNKVLYTIEFYPEEGKYHYSGHRNCNISLTPEEQRATNGICPVCKKHVTDGVMRRVQELANDDPRSSTKKNATGLKWFVDPKGVHPPYVKLVPLLEIISEAIGSPVASPKTKVIFDMLCEELGCELDVLLKSPIEDVRKVLNQHPKGQHVAEGIEKVRSGAIVIKPGYDGVYGVVKIWTQGEESTEQVAISTENSGEAKKKDQLGLGI